MRPFSNIRIPQYYLHTGATGKKALKDLQKLNGIIVTSNAASTAMVSIGIDVARIAVVYGGSSVDAGSQSNGNESQTREEYTDGKQYFMFKEGPEENLMFLLKAFSKFKKRQKSEMKLVVLKSNPEKNESYYSILQTYKYRDDVILLSPDNKKALIAAAYALIILEDDGFVIDALDAMAMFVPVITSDNSPVKECGEGIALHYTKDSIDDLAENLMTMYRNEDVWSRLAVRGREKALQYSWARTAETIGSMLYKNEHD
jgi:glycosyltransferase involved in cell wall biosynthesis